MENKEVNNQDKEYAIKIIDIYYQEWKHRCEHFWKRLSQFTAVIFVTATLPITFRIFGDLELPKMPLVFFPIAAIFLSIACMLFLWAENARTVATDNTMKRIINDTFGGKFNKEPLALFRDDNRNQHIIIRWFLRWRIGTWVPMAVTFFLITLSSLIIYLITTGKI